MRAVRLVKALHGSVPTWVAVQISTRLPASAGPPENCQVMYLPRVVTLVAGVNSAEVVTPYAVPAERLTAGSVVTPVDRRLADDHARRADDDRAVEA